MLSTSSSSPSSLTSSPNSISSSKPSSTNVTVSLMRTEKEIDFKIIMILKNRQLINAMKFEAKMNKIPVSGNSPYVLRFLASSGVYFRITSAFAS